MRKLFLTLFIFSLFSLNAQVEVFRNTEDTSSYIRPEDTITCAPVYGLSDEDFLFYIENRFNLRNTAASLDFAGDKFKISFYVGKDGMVTDYKTLSFTNANMATELERVITEMPAWNPGFYSGRKKKTLMIYTLNIRKVTNNVNAVDVSISENNYEYTDQTKKIKWFLVAGSVMVLIAVLLTKK